MRRRSVNSAASACTTDTGAACCLPECQKRRCHLPSTRGCTAHGVLPPGAEGARDIAASRQAPALAGHLGLGVRGSPGITEAPTVFICACSRRGARRRCANLYLGEGCVPSSSLARPSRYNPLSPALPHSNSHVPRESRYRLHHAPPHTSPARASPAIAGQRRRSRPETGGESTIRTVLGRLRLAGATAREVGDLVGIIFCWPLFRRRPRPAALAPRREGRRERCRGERCSAGPAPGQTCAARLIRSGALHSQRHC